MGNKQAKPIPKPNIDRIITEVLLNVKTELNKKVTILKTHENKLIETIQSGIYSMDNLKQHGEMGVHHFKAVQALRKVANHIQFMKDSSESIFQAQSQPEMLQNYVVNINSIIWATPKLNLTAVKEFNRMIVEQFGIEYVKQAHHGINVDQTLIPLVIYQGIEEFEKAIYLESFLNRNNQIEQNRCFKLREYINQVKTQRLVQQQQNNQRQVNNWQGWNVPNQPPMQRGMTFPNNNQQSYGMPGNGAQMFKNPNISMTGLNQDQSTINGFQNALNNVKNHQNPNQNLNSFLGDQGFNFGGNNNQSVSKSAFGHNLPSGNVGMMGK